MEKLVIGICSNIDTIDLGEKLGKYAKRRVSNMFLNGASIYAW